MKQYILGLILIFFLLISTSQKITNKKVGYVDSNGSVLVGHLDNGDEFVIVEHKPSDFSNGTILIEKRIELLFFGYVVKESKQIKILE
jgi:hypothetical protein